MASKMSCSVAWANVGALATGDMVGKLVQVGCGVGEEVGMVAQYLTLGLQKHRYHRLHVDETVMERQPPGGRSCALGAGVVRGELKLVQVP